LVEIAEGKEVRFVLKSKIKTYMNELNDVREVIELKDRDKAAVLYALTTS